MANTKEGVPRLDVFDLFAKIGLDTSDYEKGLDGASSKTHSFADKLKSGFSTIAKVGAVALTATTTAVAAFAKSSVDTGMAFDSAMSQVAATMDTTVDQIGDLRDFAMEMGASTAFSANQAAEALNYMALAGYSADESMQALPNVLNLAAAGSIDLAYASDMVTDAQSALGLTMEESAELVDKMAMTSSKSNTSVAQLGEAILTVGGTAKTLAGGTTELSTALGILADNGVKGAEGGTALRNIILSLSAPTDTAAKAMKSLGVEVFDAEGNMRPLNETFGDLNNALSTMTQGERTQVLSEIFNKVDLKSVDALLSNTGERFDELSGYIDNATGSAENMAKVQLDNLAGDITMFKSAMEGAQIILSDQLTPSLRGFVQFGTNAISTLSTAFQEGGLSGAMEALGTILSDGLNMVIENLPKMVDAGMKLLGALGKGVIDNLPTIASAAVDIVVMLVQGIIDALPRIASAAVEIIGSLARELVEATPQLLNSGMDMLIALVDGIMSGLPDMIARLPQIIEDFLNFITEELPSILDKGQDLMDSLVDGILNALPALLDAVPKIITSLVNFIGENLPKIVQAGINIQMKLIFGLLQAIPEFYKATPKIIGAIADGLLSLLGTVVDVGKNIVRGLWDGIVSMAGWITNKVTGFFKDIFSGAKEVDMTSNLRGATSGFPINGSFASGLNYVPFDGFIAELHKGEMIVPAKEAQGLRGGIQYGNINITVNGAQYQDEQSLAQAIAQEIQYMTDRSRMTFA